MTTPGSTEACLAGVQDVTYFFELSRARIPLVIVHYDLNQIP